MCVLGRWIDRRLRVYRASEWGSVWRDADWGFFVSGPFNGKGQALRFTANLIFAHRK